VEVLVARLEECVDRLEKIGADHEARIRTLENRQWYAMGIVGFILAAAPFVFKAL
jgi:hypothetical protein